MEVNIEELELLLREKFNGNQSIFAEEMGLERTHVNKVFKNKGKGAGAIFCGAIIKYCNNNNLDYQKYIFLRKNVNKFTKTIRNKKKESEK